MSILSLKKKNFILDLNKKILSINLDLLIINNNRYVDNKLTPVFEI